MLRARPCGLRRRAFLHGEHIQVRLFVGLVSLAARETARISNSSMVAWALVNELSCSVEAQFGARES